ncbi:ABC transporter permease [Streptomyces sp. SID2999]|uniref:ABC transporter permease n=1 Tax=Streptomyces sp. SID2999 TaxID=2690258 RepID=UPI00136EC8C8|nr:ABC transporter permease [Streptomyces sp. SID2999]MYZ08965.1 ABC transporter permease [Streptomyces sp. SID2999]
MSSLSVSARWTFRLHRWALFTWATLVVVGAGLLVWLAGPLMDQAARGWQQLRACQESMCTVDSAAMGRYSSLYDLLTDGMFLMPFLVAAWAGATLTARELESGTALLAWTQGVTPVRWLASRLALPTLAVTAGGGVLVALHRYAWSASADRVDTRAGWWLLRTFYANGPALVAVCLAALALGALTGLLLPRTLPALGITVGATALLFAAVHWVMPYLWPSVTEVSRFQDGYRGLYTGVELSHGMMTRSGARVPTPECDARSMDVCRRIYEQHDGTGFYTSFHPASHYWPLQLTTTALLLLVTALLTAASFVVLRRRTG